MNNNYFYNGLLRFIDNIREQQRWKTSTYSSRPRVYYGQRHIPNQENVLSGGLVKLQDLVTQFPNNVKNANILYLISSALPPNPDLVVRYAIEAGIPIVLNQNGVAYPAWHGPGWEKTNERLCSVYQYASFIIFQSKFCKISADKFLAPTDCPNTILYNPVNTNQFKPPINENQIGEEYQLLIAGSHNFFYKVKTAIDTLLHLLRQGEKVSLKIAGRCCWRATEPECHREIQAYSEQKGIHEHIQVSGAYTQQEAIELFQKADILLHPTYNDSCPRLVVEAMACGTPVIYSSTGGTPELVANNAGIGVQGPLDWDTITPPNPEQLGQAIQVVKNNYKSYSHGARDHAVKNHHVDDWLLKHEQIFPELLKNSSK